ncbi:Membrane-bound transcription factor site-1 protease [Orobanche minor]
MIRRLNSQISILIISSIFLLISLFVYHFLYPQPHTFTSPVSTSGEPPAKDHIIRFSQYKKSQDLREYLERNVQSKGWAWVERHNPAMNFPTDFALVVIEETLKDFLIGEFGKLELVKDVSLDLSYQRAILEEKPVGTFVNRKKKPGKIFTRMSFTEGEDQAAVANTSGKIGWRSLMMQKSQVTSLFGADSLWSKGYTGTKVKMAIFDTGIRTNHPHFRNIKERTNWTNEDTLNDNLGHGTFVAGVIAGQDAECLGFAPDTEIFAFRVFTDAQREHADEFSHFETPLAQLFDKVAGIPANATEGQPSGSLAQSYLIILMVSYTSWFLDAFNYAIATKMDVLNLSIGGPDYQDLPFVEKVWEITANNIIMVSAIGNDGPLYGTLNNPADQSDVIGVGGIDYSDHIASFSSRGMSTWEIPHGYGRVKPDVVAYGREILGSKISTGCKSLSGTSVASPVVAGIVCLLVSVIPENKRKETLNPGSMRQALVEGASKLSGPNMYEQGAGRVDLLESYEILKSYEPRASIFPSVLDYMDCPYAWPFCRQPLYAWAMPVIFNVTILNGMGVTGYVENPPLWLPFSEEGNLLSIHFTYSDVIWPWTGYLALHMQIKEEGVHFSGEIEGNVTVNICSPPAQGERSPRRSTCVLRLKLKVVPTPRRTLRVLWDQFHNIKYPPGYIPRDSLDVRNDILDWHGDHLHTNFHIMFNMLRDAGYYVETLGSPFTCFDANQYGTLLLVDLEDEYFAEEIEKLKDDVINNGLGLAVFADWYNVDSMMKMKFFDDNTRSWWTPVTGGANVPALNDLLEPFGIAFGDKILNGDFVINGEQSRYASGTDIVKFPEGGYLHSFPFLDSSESGATQNVLLSGMSKADSPILGLLEFFGGRIAVYGDSNCLDSSHMVTNCYWLLKKILEFTARDVRDPVLFLDSSRLDKMLHLDNNQLPSRRRDVNFSTYSAVVGKKLICGRDARFEVWGTKGWDMNGKARNLRLPGNADFDVGGGLNSTKEIPAKKFKPIESKLDPSLGNKYLGYIYGDDLDFPELVESHWLMPAIMAVSADSPMEFLEN